MHILDISTNTFAGVKNQEKNKKCAATFFNDIKRAVAMQSNCILESDGWYIDNGTHRMHVNIIIFSNDPETIKHVCEIIEDMLSIPKKALIFTM